MIMVLLQATVTGSLKGGAIAGAATMLGDNIDNMVKVKEEYLVYDMVSLISLIGGFMGISVGLSFYSTSAAILRGVEMVLNWEKKRNEKNIKVAELPRFWTKTEEPTTPGLK